MSPVANYDSDGKRIGGEIGKSPPFPPILAAVYTAAKNIEWPEYREVSIKVSKMKYPKEVKVSSPVAYSV